MGTNRKSFSDELYERYKPFNSAKRDRPWRFLLIRLSKTTTGQFLGHLFTYHKTTQELQRFVEENAGIEIVRIVDLDRGNDLQYAWRFRVSGLRD